jgi:hypothetical protein
MKTGKRLRWFGNRTLSRFPLIGATRLALVALFLVTLAAPAAAKEKKKTYDVPADVLLDAAISVARTQHVLTHVERSERLFSFSTNRSLGSPGLTCNAVVIEEGKNKSTLTISMKKNHLVFAWGAGGRIAEKFFAAVNDELKKRQPKPPSDQE